MISPWLRSGLLALAAVIVVVAGFVAGRQLKGGGTQEVYQFDLEAAAYEGLLADVARSKGGFTGFGDDGALEGDTFVSGEVTSISPGEIGITGPQGSEQSLKIDPATLVGRLEASEISGLADGQQVAIIADQAGTKALSILILAAR